MTISEIYSLSLHDALPIWAPFFLNNLPLEILFAALVGLLIISAFFSGSETALMSLNRYRLRHLTKKGHRSAHKVTELQIGRASCRERGNRTSVEGGA